MHFFWSLAPGFYSRCLHDYLVKENIANKCGVNVLQSSIVNILSSINRDKSRHIYMMILSLLPWSLYKSLPKVGNKYISYSRQKLLTIKERTLKAHHPPW